MGRHKKPPRKCGSPSCDRIITTRSLCARCQKRKQRAKLKQHGGVVTVGQSGPSPPIPSLPQANANSATTPIAPAPPPNAGLQRVLPTAPIPTSTMAQTALLSMPMPPTPNNPPPPLPSGLGEKLQTLDHGPISNAQAFRCQRVLLRKTPKDKFCELCMNLLKAVENGHVKCVRGLLETSPPAGEEILNKVDENQNSILHEVARASTLHDREYPDILNLFLKLTTEDRIRMYVNQKNIHGQTPLFVASRFHDCGTHEYGYTDAFMVCRMFIHAGADPNTMDNDGFTPLHETTWQITRLLITFNTNVNVRSKTGDTPLHRAAALLRANVVHELITAGQAQQGLTNNLGQTPRDLAATVSYTAFQHTGMSQTEFEREQQLTLQQFHNALHLISTPHHQRQRLPQLNPHSHQPPLPQPSVGSPMSLHAPVQHPSISHHLAHHLTQPPMSYLTHHQPPPHHHQPPPHHLEPHEHHHTGHHHLGHPGMGVPGRLGE